MEFDYDSLDLSEEPDIDMGEMGTSTDLVRHPSGIVPAVTHVVCQFDLGLRVNLQFLNIKLCNTRYTHEAYPTKKKQPSKFKRLMLEFLDPPGPKAHLGVFNTGKVRIFGAKTVAKARHAARLLVKKLRRFEEYEAAQVVGFKIENYVAGTARELLGPVDLRLLCTLLTRLPQATVTTRRFNCRPDFEPEVFNALRCKRKMNGDNVCVEVFASGAVRITGCKTLDTLYEAFETVYPDLVRVKRPTDNSNTAPPRDRKVWKDATTS